jgi:putative transport protein
VSLAIPEVVKTVFFDLFLFAVALRIGPQFFSGLQRDGWRMVTIAVIVAVVAPLLSYLCGNWFHLPAGSVAGLLAGSNNSSASFGAASSAITAGSAHLKNGTSADQVVGNLSASFALSYLVAEISFVLLIKYLPKILRFDAVAAEKSFEAEMRKLHPAPLPGTAAGEDVDDPSVAVRAYRLDNSVVGWDLDKLRTAAPRVSIERVKRGDSWLHPTGTTVLEHGDELVVAAPLVAHIRIRDLVGPELADTEARQLIPLSTVDVVVQHDEITGRALQELRASVGPGLYPQAIFRAGQELPLGPETELKLGDIVRVTGTEQHIAELSSKVGPVVRSSYASDILTLAIGLVIGGALGAIPIPMFGMSVTLGASAILIAGIVLGWLKTRHPAFGGAISEGGRSLIEDLGLQVFTAVLGINAGVTVLQMLTGGSVWGVVISCLIVSSVPAIIACLMGLYLLKLNPALLMGALAGARQCTAALYAAQEASEGSVPAIGYPVPLAITTLVMSIEAYFFAAFS